jgi:hypothetical protein
MIYVIIYEGVSCGTLFFCAGRGKCGEKRGRGVNLTGIIVIFSAKVFTFVKCMRRKNASCAA